MKIKRQTTYFLRVTVEDSDRKHVKLWASPQATMEVPLETDAVMWQQLRRELANLGMFGPSILDEAEEQLFSSGHARLPHTNLVETHFQTLGLYD